MTEPAPSTLQKRWCGLAFQYRQFSGLGSEHQRTTILNGTRALVLLRKLRKEGGLPNPRNPCFIRDYPWLALLSFMVLLCHPWAFPLPSFLSSVVLLCHPWDSPLLHFIRGRLWGVIA